MLQLRLVWLSKTETKLRRPSGLCAEIAWEIQKDQSSVKYKKTSRWVQRTIDTENSKLHKWKIREPVYIIEDSSGLWTTSPQQKGNLLRINCFSYNFGSQHRIGVRCMRNLASWDISQDIKKLSHHRQWCQRLAWGYWAESKIRYEYICSQTFRIGPMLLKLQASLPAIYQKILTGF